MNPERGSVSREAVLAVTHQRGDRLAFWCPVCWSVHEVQIQGSPRWEWNGSRERPTFRPSVRVQRHDHATGADVVCHSFVTDGVIEYCSDSHAFAGEQRTLIPFPDPYLRDAL